MGTTILLCLQLATIILLLTQRKGKRIIMKLTDLIAQVKANTDLEKSAIQCINGLAAKLEEARGSQAAIDGVIAEMRNQAEALSAAIKANTDVPPVSEEKGEDTTE
jgi:hypothetical protein